MVWRSIFEYFHVGVIGHHVPRHQGCTFRSCLGNAQGGLGGRQPAQWCHTNFGTIQPEGPILKGIPIASYCPSLISIMNMCVCVFICSWYWTELTLGSVPGHLVNWHEATHLWRFVEYWLGGRVKKLPFGEWLKCKPQSSHGTEGGLFEATLDLYIDLKIIGTISNCFFRFATSFDGSGGPSTTF